MKEGNVKHPALAVAIVSTIMLLVFLTALDLMIYFSPDHPFTGYWWDSSPFLWIGGSLSGFWLAFKFIGFE